MKFLLVALLALSTFNAHAQSTATDPNAKPGDTAARHGNSGYGNSGYGTPGYNGPGYSGAYGYNNQYIELQPGAAATIQVLAPTTVVCKGDVMMSDPALRCTVEKGATSYGSTFYTVKQAGKEISDRFSSMDSALQALDKLRNARLCN